MDTKFCTSALFVRAEEPRKACHQNVWISELKATGNDWNAHRRCIENLYRNEKRPLPEVMRITKKTCNLRASARMYRHRIHRWGLDKNRKEPEMRAIARKRQDRQAAGKASVFELRGEQIDFDEVVAYFKRKGTSIDQVPRSGSRTPSELICKTPPPPTTYKLAEALLATIRVYMVGSFDQKTWYIDNAGDCVSVKRFSVGSAPSYDWLDTCLAFRFFLKGMMNDGWRQIRRLNAQAPNILSEETPRTVGDLLWFVCTAQAHRKPEIAILTLKQFSMISEMMYGRHHPLSRICLYALRILSDEVDSIQLFLKVWESILDFWGNNFRRCIHAHRLIYLANLPDARQGQQLIQRMLGSLPDLEDNTARTHAAILSSLSLAYARTADWPLVVETAETLINLVGPRKDDERFSEHLRHGLHYLAFAQYQLSDIDRAVKNLQASLAIETEFFGRKEGKVLHDLHDLSQLEAWLEEKGNNEGAVEARRKRLAITNSMEDFMI